MYIILQSTEIENVFSDMKQWKKQSMTSKRLLPHFSHTYTNTNIFLIKTPYVYIAEYINIWVRRKKSWGYYTYLYT